MVQRARTFMADISAMTYGCPPRRTRHGVFPTCNAAHGLCLSTAFHSTYRANGACSRAATMTLPTFAGLMLAAFAGTALAAEAPPQAAPPSVQAQYVTTVVRHDTVPGTFVPAIPLAGVPAHPYAQTVLRTDLADGDFRPAQAVPAD